MARKKQPAKFDRCVKAVKRRGSAANAYAVCAKTRNPAKVVKTPYGGYVVRWTEGGKVRESQDVFTNREDAESEALHISRTRLGRKNPTHTVGGVQFSAVNGVVIWSDNWSQLQEWASKKQHGFHYRYGGPDTYGHTDIVYGKKKNPSLSEVQEADALGKDAGRSATSSASTVIDQAFRSAVSRFGKVSAADRKQLRGAFFRGFRTTFKRNPADQAAEVFKEFHGYSPKEIVTVTQKVHRHKHLASAGELVGLQVAPVNGAKTRRIEGLGDALLTFNEKKNQLFVSGGDQFLPESELKKFVGNDYDHEWLTLGELTAVGYFTDKTHLGSEGGEAIYDHKFRTTNENGRHITVTIARYPDLMYHTLNQEFVISGGSYTIRAEGIDK